jgi:general stress protein 26
MNEKYSKQAVGIIKSIRYATIATSSKGGQPWNSPVAHDYDDKLSIYWVSDKQNQHSLNIRENCRVFIVIYDSTAPEGTGTGVYIEAIAKEVNDSEELKAIQIIDRKNVNAFSEEDFLGNATRRVYKASPQKVWINDAEEKDGVFLRDYRVELDLSNLASHLV